MVFEPQNKLERSLMQAASDPASRPQFYKDLVESDIFIIQEHVPAHTGKRMLEEETTIAIGSITLDGKQYLPIFSSLQRLQAVLQKEAGYIAVNALEFFKLVQGAAVFLNPGSDYGKEFTAKEIAGIIDGTMGRERIVVQQATEVTVGQPANPPFELLNALKDLFKQRERVARAWNAQIYAPELHELPHTLIGIETSDDWDKLSAEVGAIVQSVPVPDPPVDLIRVTHGVMENYFKNNKPFYEKTSWLCIGKTDIENTDELILKTHSNRQHLPALAKQLTMQHVFIFARWSNPQSTSMTIRDFIAKDGRSFIPIFSDESHFRQESVGSGHEKEGVSIDGNLLAHILDGQETLVLNPGSSAPIELIANDLKVFVDPARLPPGVK